MRIKQYVYFALRSDELTPAEITERIGLAPDQSITRGTKVSGSRPVPRANSWAIVCDQPGLTVDEQIERVLERIRLYQETIRDCASTHGCSATLQVVRYLGAWLADGDGEETYRGLQKLPGQHQLLGWHLSADVLAFLIDIRAELDVDEYG